MNKKNLGVILACVVGMSFTNFANANANVNSELIPEQSIFKICQLLSLCKEDGNDENPVYEPSSE